MFPAQVLSDSGSGVEQFKTRCKAVLAQVLSGSGPGVDG